MAAFASAHSSDVGETQGWEDATQTKRLLLSMVLWNFIVLSSLRQKGLVVCEPEEGGNYLRGPTSIVKVLWQLNNAACLLQPFLPRITHCDNANVNPGAMGTTFEVQLEWDKCNKNENKEKYNDNG